MPICTVSLATTNAWTDKQSGARFEESEWHRVVFFGRLAEVVASERQMLGTKPDGDKAPAEKRAGTVAPDAPEADGRHPFWRSVLEGRGA